MRANNSYLVVGRVALTALLLFLAVPGRTDGTNAGNDDVGQNNAAGSGSVAKDVATAVSFEAAVPPGGAGFNSQVIPDIGAKGKVVDPGNQLLPANASNGPGQVLAPTPNVASPILAAAANGAGPAAAVRNAAAVNLGNQKSIQAYQRATRAAQGLNATVTSSGLQMNAQAAGAPGGLLNPGAPVGPANPSKGPAPAAAPTPAAAPAPAVAPRPNAGAPASAPAGAGPGSAAHIADVAETGNQKSSLAYQNAARAALGLTAAPGDAGPAGANGRALLNRSLAPEPAALIRRPDFFQVLPREHFQSLKGDYHERLDLHDTAFRDMGLTAADRDFQWSRSCAKLSGQCNPAESALHYTVGHDVPPETLERTYKKVHPAAPDGDDVDEAEMDKIRAENQAAARERGRTESFAGTALDGLRARFKRLLGALGGLGGLGDEAGENDGAASAEAAGPGSSGFAVGSAGPRATREFAYSRSARRKPLPVPLPEGSRKTRRALVVLVLAAAAVFIVLAWLYRRRDEKSQDEKKGDPS